MIRFTVINIILATDIPKSIAVLSREKGAMARHIKYKGLMIEALIKPLTKSATMLSKRAKYLGQSKLFWSLSIQSK